MWTVCRQFEKDLPEPTVKCKASYRAYATTRKSHFPDIFDEYEIDPVTIETKFAPHEALYGDLKADEHVKLIGRKAERELQHDVICSLHVDNKLV